MGKTIVLDIKKENKIDLDIKKKNNLELNINRPSGTSNYNALTNKPRINGVELKDNKLDYELFLQHKMDDITEQEIDTIIFG